MTTEDLKYLLSSCGGLPGTIDPEDDVARRPAGAALDALKHLEDNLLQHIHEENNVLFLRAIALEAEKVAATIPYR